MSRPRASQLKMVEGCRLKRLASSLTCWVTRIYSHPLSLGNCLPWLTSWAWPLGTLYRIEIDMDGAGNRGFLRFCVNNSDMKTFLNSYAWKPPCRNLSGDFFCQVDSFYNAMRYGSRTVPRSTNRPPARMGCGLPQCPAINPGWQNTGVLNLSGINLPSIHCLPLRHLGGRGGGDDGLGPSG
jgi:hypothetical protein